MGYPDATCSLFVYTNNGGIPGTCMDKKAFMPVKGVNSVTFSNPPTFNSDFFIVAWVNPVGSTGMALDSDGLDYADRMKRSLELPTWVASGDLGDYILRATVSYSAVEEDASRGVDELYPISPNPVRGKANISYVLKDGTSVDLRIYDAAGKLVRTLEEGVTAVGTRNVEWNTRDDNGNKVGSGIYFCKLVVGNTNVFTRRIVVL